MIEFSSVGEGSKPFDGASNISSSSFIATFHVEADAVRACRLARGSLWARVLGPGMGPGRGLRVTVGGASPLSFYQRCLGTPREVHLLHLLTK